MPQWAIAQLASSASTAVKPSMAARNSNECSKATARLKSALTVGEQLVSKLTVPNFSPDGAPACCSCCACANEAPARTVDMAATVKARNIVPPSLIARV
jgi:hypothetical protein